MNIILEGTSQKLEIDILRRSDPSGIDYWDSNWLDSIFKLTGDELDLHFATNLRTDDFKRFFEQLHALLNQMAETAIFNTMEEGISFTISRNENGAMCCVGTANQFDGRESSFSFETTYSNVQNLLPLIEQATIAFPVIGEYY